MSDAAKDKCIKKTVHFWFGCVVAFTGYSAVLIQAVVGCEFLSTPWLFWIGAPILIVADIHETAISWPLSDDLLAHHIAVFILAVSYMEFQPAGAVPVHI